MKEQELKPLIVKNVRPIGSRPIMIVTSWMPDEMGGPAISESHYMIRPGDKIDLSILGLEQVEDAKEERGKTE